MLSDIKTICIGLRLLFAALLVLQGCGRKPSTPVLQPDSEAPRVQEAQPTPAKQAAAPTSNATPKAAVVDRLPTAPNDSSLRLPIQQELTGAIHLYQMDNQKMPPDFDTLIKAKYLKAMPKPPPGKRFALDRNRMQVVITD